MSDNRKSRKRNPKTKSNVNTKSGCDASERTITRFKSNNDVSWYTPTTQLLNDSASLSYNHATGMPLDLGTEAYHKHLESMIPTGHIPPAVATPGIMSLTAVIGPGISKDNTSAVNIAARNIYSFVRHANSGHSNYDAPDLMMYLLAMDSVYSLYNSAKRLYGVLSLYDVKNRYLPSALVKAMGFNYEDMLLHIPDLRYFLNNVCHKINTLRVPNIMDLMIRHSWLFSNVYADSDLPTAQMYVFRMLNVYQFDEFTLPAKLKWVDVAEHGNMSFAELVELFNSILDPIIESEDFNVMSGDILKAYGEGALFTVSEVADDYSVKPVYDETVLLQIDNSIVLPGVPRTDITMVVDTNTLIWKPEIGEINGLGWNTRRILNHHKADITPADTMEATRLVPVVEESYVNSRWKCAIESCGSDFICDAEIYYYGIADATGKLGVVANPFTSCKTVFVADDDRMGFHVLLGLVSKFKYHPQFWIYVYAGDNTTKSFDITRQDMKEIDLVSVMVELDHYTTVGDVELKRMHDTAIMSLFGVKSK